jgi:hypothetical protein
MKKSQSRFGNLVSLSKGRPIVDDEPETSEANAVVADQAAPEPKPVQPPATISETDAPKLGRPKTGKRSKPGFRSVSLWLKAETFADADELLTRRRRLKQISDGQPRDVSELAESLIADWLKNQASE